METIIDLCNILNRAIHEPLYNKFYNIPNELKYNRTFTSIDLIEDTQIAIEEFQNIKLIEKERSTLLIYGLLQSFFLQQDGLYNLYKHVVDESIEIGELFDKFSFNHNIREVRNDIAGHPTDRRKKECYFITKGSTTKNKFTYVGYTPNIKLVQVDLEIFISQQSDFANKILKTVQQNILNKIEMKKGEPKNKSLKELTVGIDRHLQLILRGVIDETRSFQAKGGLHALKDTIDEISKELNVRSNENLLSETSETLKMINYIIERFNEWIDTETLLGNMDAEVFFDSLKNQIKYLKTTFEGIDPDFNK